MRESVKAHFVAVPACPMRAAGSRLRETKDESQRKKRKMVVIR